MRASLAAGGRWPWSRSQCVKVTVGENRLGTDEMFPSTVTFPHWDCELSFKSPFLTRTSQSPSIGHQFSARVWRLSQLNSSWIGAGQTVMLSHAVPSIVTTRQWLFKKLVLLWVHECVLGHRGTSTGLEVRAQLCRTVICFYISMGSRDWTWVTRLVWQVPSCQP